MVSLYIVVATLMLLGVTWASNEGDLNAREFQAMCTFISLLKQKPPLPTLKLGEVPVDTIGAAEELESHVILLNASTTDDATFSQLEAASPYSEAQSNPIVKQLTQKEWESLLETWKKSRGQKKTEDGGISRPTNPGAREVAHQRIGKVLFEMKKVLAHLLQVRDKMEENNLEARKDMLAAIYGQAVVEGAVKGEANRSEIAKKLGELGPAAESFGAAGSADYATACKGEHAGYSIISDLACLCTRSTVSTEALCGTTVKQLNSRPAGTGAWSNNVANLAKNVFAACPTQQETSNTDKFPTVESLLSIILRHTAMMGKNSIQAASGPNQGDHGKGTQFILGFHVIGRANTLTCDGGDVGTASSAVGVCVTYIHHLGAGKEIPWIQRVKNAAAKLKENERYETLEYSLVSRLRSLKDNAEIYYENAIQPSQALSTSVGIAPAGKSNMTQAISSSSIEKEVPTSGGLAAISLTLSSTPAILTLLTQ